MLPSTVNDSHTDGLNKARDSSPGNLPQPLNQDLTLTSPVCVAWLNHTHCIISRTNGNSGRFATIGFYNATNDYVTTETARVQMS